MAWGKAVPAWHGALLPTAAPGGAAVTSATRLQAALDASNPRWLSPLYTIHVTRVHVHVHVHVHVVHAHVMHMHMHMHMYLYGCRRRSTY